MRREPSNPSKLLAQPGVYSEFTVSAAHNPGFSGRLALGKGLLVLGCSTMVRLAEKDEPEDEELMRTG